MTDSENSIIGTSSNELQYEQRLHEESVPYLSVVDLTEDSRFSLGVQKKNKKKMKSKR